MKGFVRACEIDGYDFLIDCGMLYKPASIVVQKGYSRAEIYLSEPISVRRWGKFSEKEMNRILDLVEENQDELLDCFYSVREDEKRGRLHDRHVIEYGNGA